MLSTRGLQIIYSADETGYAELTFLFGLSATELILFDVSATAAEFCAGPMPRKRRTAEPQGDLKKGEKQDKKN